MFSLTTQMPNTIEIVSNNESMRCRKTTVDGRTVILRKSRCKIERNNVQAYTVLQLLSEIGKDSDIGDRAREAIKRYMQENKVTTADLISLAKFFPAQTMKNLIYSGVLNAFTQ